MSDGDGGERERLLFWLYPSAYTLPARLASIEPGLDEALTARLLATPRLAFRLSRRIIERAGLPAGPPPGESAGFALARLPAAELVRLARACGALLHHAVIRGVVLNAERRALRAFLGPDAHELALRRAQFLRLPARPVPPPGGLEAAIERDGLACLRARLGAEPPGIAERAGLKLAPGSGYDATDGELAGVAGRKLLARVCAEGDQAWRAYTS